MTQPSPNDTSNPQARILQIQNLIDQGLSKEPTPSDAVYNPNDPSYDPNRDPSIDHDQWAKTMTILQNALTSAITQANQGETNANTQASTQATLENAATASRNADTNASTAAADAAHQQVQDMLAGETNNTNRAQLQQQAQEYLSKYGAPLGKTSFSANDLGALFTAYAKSAGIDPNASLINYSGQVNMNPSLFAQGLDNAMPTPAPVPSLVSGGGGVAAPAAAPAPASLVSSPRLYSLPTGNELTVSAPQAGVAPALPPSTPYTPGVLVSLLNNPQPYQSPTQSLLTNGLPPQAPGQSNLPPSIVQRLLGQGGGSGGPPIVSGGKLITGQRLGGLQ